jgi:RND family efflux transporter MFP subunit
MRSPLLLCCVSLVSIAIAEEVAVPEAEGIMLPRHRAQLSVALEARVREVRVEEGQTVRQGDVLAILYTEAEQLDCARAEAQIKKADFHYQSKLQLKRKAGVSELEVVGAEADLEVARIELQRAQANLRDKTLTAPWAGRVLRVLKSTGETVNRAEKLIELIDHSTILVDVYLDARYLRGVRVGQKAEVRGEAIGAQAVEAAVSIVDPVVEPGSGLSRVRLQMPNADLRIPTGLPVRVKFAPAGLAAR